MSHENVEIVRRFLEAIGPESDRETLADEFFDPQVEWHDVPTYPSAGVYFGRDAFLRHAADFEDAWADWGIEVEDIRPADDRVVARIRYHGVGRASGAPLTGDVQNPATGAVFELRAGLIIRVLQYVTHTEALEVVGLSEQDARPSG
jgi:SnoaL-like protein